jgi:hypothetical protein
MANEVMVMPLLSSVIADTTLAEVGLRDQIQFLQQLQSAINGRYIGVGIATV